MNTRLTMLLLFMAINFTLYAQNGTITVIVSDADGPLIASTITIDGTSKGAISTIDGSYSIEIEPGTYTVSLQVS